MNEHNGIAVRGLDREVVRKVSAKLVELVGSIPMSGEHAAAALEREPVHWLGSPP